MIKPDLPVTNHDLAIICGHGSLPLEVADGAAAAGRQPYLIGIDSEADSEIERYPHEYIAWGQVGKLFKILRKHGIVEIVLAGGVRKRPEFGELKLDLGAFLSLPRVLAYLLEGGDNSVLSGTIRLFEARGIRVVGAHQVAPDLLAPAGIVAGRKPLARELRNLQMGFAACKALGAFDIGQAAVAEGGRVVALEGVEGTDGLLARIADLRKSGRLPAIGQHGVLVKTMKPDQDPRADMPAIGPRTVDAVRNAGLRGIGIEARHTLILQKKETIETARRQGIFIHGIVDPGSDDNG